MPLYVMMLIGSCMAAGVIGAALLARNPGQRASRLIAVVLLCSAYWSLCEILWNTSDDPESVLRWIRLSSFGWIPLGPLALDLVGELRGDRAPRFRRLVRAAYASAGISIGLYVFTPWCIRDPFRVDWGWSYELGPLFAVAFAPTIFFVASVLLVWPGTFSRSASPGERRQGLLVFAGILGPALVASVTDVLLPWLGIVFPRFGSTSILALGVIVGFSMRRYGTFLLAPDAFTLEILEALGDGVALLGADGRVRTGNGAFCHVLGRPLAEVEDRPIAEILPDLSLEVGDEIVDAETALVDVDGERIPVSVSSAPLRDDKNAVIGCVVAVRDLREVFSLRKRLVTSGRLAAVGELAASIAHEINSPITYVRANLGHLRREWADLYGATAAIDSPVDLESVFREGDEILEESLEGVDRIAEIVRDVAAISHAGVGTFELADVNALLDSALNLATLSFSVAIDRQYAERPVVRCVPQQLRQVFLNLLINAFQAIGSMGTIRLVTSTAGGRVEVRIEDDGCGIPADDLERVFDPFFTTRPVGEGTGLGLALCYRIVRNHGGEISVRSRVGAGTSVLVRLPCEEASAGA